MITPPPVHRARRMQVVILASTVGVVAIVACLLTGHSTAAGLLALVVASVISTRPRR
jgi:hypothetical protein